MSMLGVDVMVRNVQALDEKYGLFVWPSAMVLARLLWANRAWLRGKTVVEVGAGVGLPSVVCALLGCKTVATDRSDRPSVLHNCARNAARNAALMQVVRVVFVVAHCVHHCHGASFVGVTHAPAFVFCCRKGWTGATCLANACRPCQPLT